MRAPSTILGILVAAIVASAPPPAAGEIGDVYKTVKDSVVVIETTGKDLDPSHAGQMASVGGLGSGVLISDDGKVMTAAHVVQTAESVQVHFKDGESIQARVLSSQPAADLALVQLSRLPAAAQVAALGDSDEVEVGDQVFVIGAPLSLSHSLTVGHISARRMDDNISGGLAATEVFQTDAAINQGNSGGPMFNMQGEVIGIVSYIISQGGGFEGLGFAITSNMARELLLEDAPLWSGFQGQLLDGVLAKVFNLPQERGILVLRVADSSLATHLGLRGGIATINVAGQDLIVGGDIILEAFGVSIADEDSTESIRRHANAMKDGDEMVLKVLRQGEIVELKNYFFPHIFIPEAPKE